MIAEFLVRYYDKPRGRLMCLIGAFFIIPSVNSLKLSLKRDEKLLSEKTILLGRLELTERLVTRWWRK